MPGFFLSLDRARSYPPPVRKTPDTARAFFGLRCVTPPFLHVGREPPRKESPLASLPEGGVAACRDGRSFSLCCFSCVILFSPDSFSRPAGASSLKREPFGTGTACGGRNPRCLPPEGPNPQKVLRTFPGTPPGRWLAERDGRSFVSLSFLPRFSILP